MPSRSPDTGGCVVPRRSSPIFQNDFARVERRARDSRAWQAACTCTRQHNPMAAGWIEIVVAAPGFERAESGVVAEQRTPVASAESSARTLSYEERRTGRWQARRR